MGGSAFVNWLSGAHVFKAAENAEAKAAAGVVIGTVQRLMGTGGGTEAAAAPAAAPAGSATATSTAKAKPTSKSNQPDLPDLRLWRCAGLARVAWWRITSAARSSRGGGGFSVFSCPPPFLGRRIV